MTLVVTHTKVSGKPAGNDPNRVYGTHWDANHTLTGTVDASQLNANVVQSVTNDTNIQGTISGQNLTFSWGGLLALNRGGTNADLSATGGTHQVLKQSSVGAAVTVGQLAFSDISGTAAASQLPNPTASTLGGIESYAAVSHQWINAISTSGVPSSTQPAFSDISGSATNSQLATMAAWTIKMNNTSGSATPTDVTIDGLTAKATPTTSDEVPIWDAATSSMKKATLGTLPSSAGVTSIDAKTGTFTTGNGLDSTAGNIIELTAARRTLPTVQKLTSGSGATYTTPANCLWIEVYMCGGGGGGHGVSSTINTFVAGSNGNDTIFNSIHAAGGSGAPGTTVVTGNGGAGGTGGTGTATLRTPGGPGFGPVYTSSTLGLAGTGQGGGCPFFSAGTLGVGITSANGNSGAANTGAGGSSAVNNASNSQSGGGGGGGEFVYLLINSPSATYTYTVGTGGAGGSSTNTGGTGGSGVIFVIEHYGS